jgi:hypothetical protein
MLPSSFLPLSHPQRPPQHPPCDRGPDLPPRVAVAAPVPDRVGPRERERHSGLEQAREVQLEQREQRKESPDGKGEVQENPENGRVSRVGGPGTGGGWQWMGGSGSDSVAVWQW